MKTHQDLSRVHLEEILERIGQSLILVDGIKTGQRNGFGLKKVPKELTPRPSNLLSLNQRYQKSIILREI